jgi:HPr kinase/phosphorylase
MTTNAPQATHATVVAIGQWGIAIIGPSGSGKSDLALRLMDRGAELVGDDYIIITPDGSMAVARAAPKLAGKIEIRGIGILQVNYRESAILRLCIKLDEDGERLPDPWPVETLNGFAIPCLKLHAQTASAAIKAEWALKTLVDAGQWPVPDTFVDQPVDQTR